MAPRMPLSIFITTIIGATLGGLLMWRVYRTKRKKLPLIQTVAHLVKTPCAVENKIPAGEDLYIQPPGDPEEKMTSTKTRPLVQLPSTKQVLDVKPMIVTCEEDWQHVWPLVEKDLSVIPVLGLDCEWVKTNGVSMKGRSGSVSLLQMATFSGLCILVRLLEFCDEQHTIPLSLIEVLRNPHILKVGVGCYEDGRRLTRDYGLSVTCTVDLRHLALRLRQSFVSNGLSLKSLASDLLNVSLDKSFALRCSNWEADQLTPEQETYAAQDAQISIILFLHLLDLYSEAGSSFPCGISFSDLVSRCMGVVDIPFKSRGEGDDEERKRRKRKTAANESPESGDQQVPDPRKNGKKPLGVGYSARKSPLYDNCFLYAPDGQPLCTCDKKKAKWYLQKGIGVLHNEDPFIVRLLFEPSGRPDSQQDYYLTAKENLCVVCGKAHSYIRKNIVPHEYRRHFPLEMKDHNSHDILLLCTSCHAASNVHDSFLKQQLAEEFGAPQGCEEGVRLLEDSDRRRVRSAARALLTAGDALPEPRRDHLKVVIKNFLNLKDDEELTTETLQQAASLETRIMNEKYVPHGLKVVRLYASKGLRGLMELERRWRQHFLSCMHPRHLPPLWSVDHNHNKFLRKYGEDLPIQIN